VGLRGWLGGVDNQVEWGCEDCERPETQSNAKPDCARNGSILFVGYKRHLNTTTPTPSPLMLRRHDKQGKA